MDPLAAAFWGGFFTVATFMLAAAVGAAARGFRVLAAAGVTYSLVPALFVSAYLGLLPIRNEAALTRGLIHVNVIGTMVLMLQLMLVLRSYRKPITDQRWQVALLLAGVAVLAVSWALSARQGLWLATAYAVVQCLWVAGAALRKALRGNPIAWLSVGGVLLALTSLVGMVWIHTHGGRVPVAVHGLTATASIGYVTIMGWTMWMRYSHALDLRQVMAQGPSFDPVTRLPSHAQAGRLVGRFLRAGPTLPLGVVAVSLANLAALESLHGRAAYNHALYMCAVRLRRAAPLGSELGRLGDDGFLVLMRTDDPALLKHVAARVLRALTQPVHVDTAASDTEGATVSTDWVAEAGIGITLGKGRDGAGAAVATARALSRAAFATPSRIVFGETREGPLEEVKPLSTAEG